MPMTPTLPKRGLLLGLAFLLSACQTFIDGDKQLYEQSEKLLDESLQQAEAHLIAIDLFRNYSQVGDDEDLLARVLPDYPNNVGQFAGAVGAGVAPGDDHGAVEAPAAEVRDDPVESPQQRRFAGAGAPDDQG